MTRVVIIGLGAHSREIAEILRNRKLHGDAVEVIGFVSNDQEARVQTVDGLPVLGDWTWFEGVDRSEISVISSSGFPEVRKPIVERAKSIGLSFANAIFPGVYVSPDAAIGEGVVIYQNGVVCRGSSVGDHSLLNVGAIVSHDTKLERLSTINPGVNLAGNVSIGEGCYLGIGCSVIQCVTIGPWTIVGAGAAVISDLPANVTAVGVPARVIKIREKGWHEQLTSSAGK